MQFFLTGTDTNVGKTYVAAGIIRARRAAGVDCVGMKPICCGDRADAEALHAASGGAATLNVINPVWFRTPAAPYAAAMVENRAVDLDLVRENFARLLREHASVIVEGVGGWLVPITRDFWMSDLAAEFGLPVLVVVPNRLGAINHALLTVRAICANGMECAGILLNSPAPLGAVPDVATATNRAVLETLSDTRILGEFAYGQVDFPALLE